ncbi:MAG TPA: metallophosphoesterase [Jatrophihabitantaceae bacterium]|jgi:predicted MPP superfamily phosphohydrolase|nr:metallophosphoesterase [Jatrophihabitantaceae bacterium]
MPSVVRASACATGVGAAALAYGCLIERTAFTLRRFDVPVLSPGSDPIRLLHVSDLHITARQKRKQAWIRDLARLEPDIVINTGDTLSDPDGIPSVMHALEPLFAFPGGFVPGNNDYYAPKPKNPAKYFMPETQRLHGDPLPWPALAAAMSGAGWTDLTHVRAITPLKQGAVALAGTDDPHLKRARYHRIAGPAEPEAVVRIGVTHSPEPFLLAAFARDGYDLTLAGHTHGGQVRIPFGPAIVTNCGIDVHRARWLHQWDDHMYFHVCAGLGTNPYAPIRFACRPEASLLTLRPRAL